MARIRTGGELQNRAQKSSGLSSGLSSYAHLLNSESTVMRYEIWLLQEHTSSQSNDDRSARHH